jgi:threonine aldolase
MLPFTKNRDQPQNRQVCLTTPPNALRSHMAAAGIRIGGQSPAIRMVLHRDVTDQGLDATITAFQSYFTKE